MCTLSPGIVAQAQAPLCCRVTPARRHGWYVWFSFDSFSSFPSYHPFRALSSKPWLKVVITCN
uniref:Uncharacterized protein n=1 Tax=Myoviridae sp. ct6eX13 TaxID=2827660 RepID=A0A8S5T6F9_9CAUD|nr:MAG TPA: hypothetical protein [Myoviridae sp. ct6eX13]